MIRSEFTFVVGFSFNKATIVARKWERTVDAEDAAMGMLKSINYVQNQGYEPACGAGPVDISKRQMFTISRHGIQQFAFDWINTEHKTQSSSDHESVDP